VIGIPLYGRAFEDTKGLGQSYNGVSIITFLWIFHELNYTFQIGPGTIQAGVYSYNALPIAGASVFENATDITSYSYDASKQEFVSYDTPNIVKMKAQYVQANNMAGSMFWDVSCFFLTFHWFAGRTRHSFFFSSYSSLLTRRVQIRWFLLLLESTEV